MCLSCPSLCFHIGHPSACTLSSSLSLQTYGCLTLSPLLPPSVTLPCPPAAGEGKKNNCASKSDVLKCSASQREVTPWKKRHFKKSSTKFTTVVGLHSDQITFKLIFLTLYMTRIGTKLQQLHTDFRGSLIHFLGKSAMRMLNSGFRIIIIYKFLFPCIKQQNRLLIS